MSKFLNDHPAFQADISDEVGPDRHQFPTTAADRTSAIRLSLKAPRRGDESIR